MFSLKFDLLLPSFTAARDAAHRLNTALKPPRPHADPREYRRMLEELREARERVRTQALVHRNLFL